MNVVDVRGSRLDADVWDPTGATITALDGKWPPDEPGGKIHRDGDLFRDHSGGDAFPGIVRHAAGRPQRIKHYSRYTALTGGNEMESSRKKEILDLDVRHFIYATFAGTSRPPTTLETADHFKISIAAVESTYERLANAHQIALAPGSHGVWMAHPFSGLPTNYVTEVEYKRYYGN